MKVTRELFDSFLECQFKAYHKSRTTSEEGESSQKPDRSFYLQIAEQFTNNTRSALKDVSHQKTTPAATATLREGHPYLLNAKCETDDSASRLDALMRVAGESLLGDFHYEPILFLPKHRVLKVDKLVLTFDSLLLAVLQGTQPEHGRIVFGTANRTMTIRTPNYMADTEKQLRSLRDVLSRDDPPELVLNSHCSMCPYKRHCYEKAKEVDHLSLLSRMRMRDIAKLNSRGIFTVNQLSYTFRPRRRRKKSRSARRKYYHSLKALAIRQDTVYIVERPVLPTAPTSIYVDFEGDPDRGLVYLLGFVVDDGQSLERFSFWVDDETELKKVTREFLSTIGQYDDVAIYHYGNYETKSLSSLIKVATQRQTKQIKDIVNNCINVLSLIHGAIYFPTYGDGLKEIGNSLGFRWTIANASGLKSIAWRREWEKNRSRKLKNDLIRYNIEDCLALRRLVQFLSLSVDDTPSTDGKLADMNVKYGFDDETYRRYGNHEFGRITFAMDDFRFINKRSYFDYQRHKIILRPNGSIKPSASVAHKGRKHDIRTNKEIRIRRSRVCPGCKSTSIRDVPGQSVHSKIVVDLKFFKGGLKRWVTKYTSVRRYCLDCVRSFFPKRYSSIRGKYGHSLISWVTYQNVANKVSFDKIRRTLIESCQLPVPLATSSIYNCKIKAARFYQHTYRRLISQIKDWHVLHADETQVSIRGETGYVWVFTNMESVVFVFRESRESKFLFRLLKGFEGVLVSDFYKGYDGMECAQQKCLVHLMRDINRDLFKHQQDEELKHIATQFGALLRRIVETIDRYGLKKWHLGKHNRGVDRFYRDLQSRDYDSPEAHDVVKRFERHRNNLFTFLNHDGVAWHNNNAEHALKHFAGYRKNVNGTFTSDGLERYLVLLSVYETCKYRDIGFLGFLLSQERYIDGYVRNHTPSGNRRRPFVRELS